MALRISKYFNSDEYFDVVRNCLQNKLFLFKMYYFFSTFNYFVRNLVLGHLRCKLKGKYCITRYDFGHRGLKIRIHRGNVIEQTFQNLFSMRIIEEEKIENTT